MLPSNLLKARMSKGKVHPVYAPLDPGVINLAERVIETFDKNIGRKKKHLNEVLKQYEEGDFDYRLIRGLSKLLERRCVFEVESPANPSEVRMVTFEEASRVGVVSLEDRAQTIKKVGDRLNLTPEEVEKALYSDIDEELILRRFEPLPAETLIRYYNLALTQTLLFKCLRIEFTASDNWKRIFRTVKYLGLMYSVEEEKGGDDHSYRVSVDGPMALFKMTDRYGTLLAKLLPEIVASKSWSIKAEILGRDRNRIYIFELRSDDVKDIISDVGREEAPPARLYDSTVEERFAKKFDALNSGWTIKREPEPLLAGRHVLIPDFGFEKHGVKVYLEVVGFWTQEYLERKIGKLNSLVNVDMLAAVDENLACAKLRRMKGPVIYYAKDVPVKPILDHLHMREDEIFEGEAELLKSRGELNLKGEIVSVEEIAKEQTVTVDAARQFAENSKPEGYRKIGDYFISEAKLKELADKINSLGEAATFTEAAGIIEAEGLSNPQQILEALGYTVEWFGLTPEMSKIRRK